MAGSSKAHATEGKVKESKGQAEKKGREKWWLNNRKWVIGSQKKAACLPPPCSLFLSHPPARHRRGKWNGRSQAGREGKTRRIKAVLGVRHAGRTMLPIDRQATA